MVEMKCTHCGFENKDNAKFCTKCGKPLVQKTASLQTNESGNVKYIVIVLVVIILILVGVLGFSIYNMNLNHIRDSGDLQHSSALQQSGDVNTQEESSSQGVTTTQVVDSKSWVSIGSYSGSGSGSQTISVPSGKILVKLSAYPIKNYATNYLYVSGSNGARGGVDWGSHSDVETRSDSFEYTSSNQETFTIDYYETVSWKVEFFRYQ